MPSPFCSSHYFLRSAAMCVNWSNAPAEIVRKLCAIDPGGLGRARRHQAGARPPSKPACGNRDEQRVDEILQLFTPQGRKRESWWSINIQSFDDKGHFLKNAARYTRRPSSKTRPDTRDGPHRGASHHGTYVAGLSAFLSSLHDSQFGSELSILALSMHHVAHEFLRIALNIPRSSRSPQNMLGRLLRSSSLIPKKGLKVSSQRKFQFGFCMFKAARLNSDGELLAIPTPPVTRQPEFAFPWGSITNGICRLCSVANF